MRIFQSFLILVGLLVLAGCSNIAGQYLTNVSNKNAGDINKNSNQVITQKGAHQQCNQWCHNGWCSTHCEEVVSE